MNQLNGDDRFQPHLLSVREREVVDLAILGHTDEQVAQALSLSVSTINSYWVRIRGKIGQFSRTEIVARMLHLGYRDEHARMAADLEALRAQLEKTERALASVESEREAERGTGWHLLALHFTPEAVVVAKAPGDVVYANLHAQRLLESEPGALVGCAVCDLTAPQNRESRRTVIREFLEAQEPGRLVMGVEEPCYALTCHGENFRAVIVVEGFTTPQGFMAALTLKPYLGEIDAIIRSLRKPLTLL